MRALTRRFRVPIEVARDSSRGHEEADPGRPAPHPRSHGRGYVGGEVFRLASRRQADTSVFSIC